ncbi:hypothetical protein IQ31_02702 [Sphingobacterium siyangense]|uniref:Uncharacterized protein n=1 Tax=Sphingobacterium siyangense TaxID=459529 RepID=A0A562MIM1_9SPHI|nr:hypothetical protein IQ31_02702 [Sphingobacterium siyangense]
MLGLAGYTLGFCYIELLRELFTGFLSDTRYNLFYFGGIHHLFLNFVKLNCENFIKAS